MTGYLCGGVALYLAHEWLICAARCAGRWSSLGVDVADLAVAYLEAGTAIGLAHPWRADIVGLRSPSAA
jgi:hypothetical protein